MNIFSFLAALLWGLALAAILLDGWACGRTAHLWLRIVGTLVLGPVMATMVLLVNAGRAAASRLLEQAPSVSDVYLSPQPAIRRVSLARHRQMRMPTTRAPGVRRPQPVPSPQPAVAGSVGGTPHAPHSPVVSPPVELPPRVTPAASQPKLRPDEDTIHIVVQSGPGAGAAVRVPQRGGLVVRRGWPGEQPGTGEITLVDNTVSRGQHCVIVRTANGFRLDDSSRHGTIVDGQRILGSSHPLRVGSIIKVGRSSLALRDDIHTLGTIIPDAG